MNMSNPDEEFAKRFVEACEDAGLPSQQNALGKSLGVSGPMAWNYKNGVKIPSMGTAIRIADKTGVCVEWLLTGRGPKYPGLKEAAKDWLDISQLPTDSKAAIRAVLHSLSKQEPEEQKRVANGDSDAPH